MLYLSLAMHVADPAVSLLDGPNGPLFHQWLPDGSNDAIVFPFEAPQKALRIWFVRRGYMDGGFVRYAFDKNEVDEHAMRRQGWLDAGPLRGEAAYGYTSDEEITAIREDRSGSDEYMRIGKRIGDFLYTTLRGFLDTLRLQYGRYWIRELRPWDSRTESLGGYCQGLFHLKWRESEGAEWRPFLPDEPIHNFEALRIPGKGFGEFITEEDWRHIQATVNPNMAHPVALRIAGRAHRLSNEGFLEEAYIQSVTALELAIKHFLTSRTATFGKSAELAAKTFTDQSIASQLSLLAVLTGLICPQVLEAASRVIDIRNKIVHEAQVPSVLSKDDLVSALRCTQLLLGLRKFKTPHLTNGNQLAAVDPNAG